MAKIPFHCTQESHVLLQQTLGSSLLTKPKPHGVLNFLFPQEGANPVHPERQLPVLGKVGKMRCWHTLLSQLFSNIYFEFKANLGYRLKAYVGSGEVDHKELSLQN